MPRFFVMPNQIAENTITIDGEDAKHIKTVLRSKVNESITVCDGCGYDYECVISKLELNIVEASIIKKFESVTEPHVKITLFQGLPKSDKMELIIQKCVELGVHKIVPVATSRTIVKLDKKDKELKKIERWQKISESASKQSGRGIIPEICSVISFKEALQQSKELNGAVIPYENEEHNGLKYFVEKFCGESIGVFIGPEGGFDENEIDQAINNGVLPVTLGKRILRTETAGFAAIAIIVYELG